MAAHLHETLKPLYQQHVRWRMDALRGLSRAFDAELQAIEQQEWEGAEDYAYARSELEDLVEYQARILLVATYHAVEVTVKDMLPDDAVSDRGHQWSALLSTHCCVQITDLPHYESLLGRRDPPLMSLRQAVNSEKHDRKHIDAAAQIRKALGHSPEVSAEILVLHAIAEAEAFLLALVDRTKYTTGASEGFMGRNSEF